MEQNRNPALHIHTFKLNKLNLANFIDGKMKPKTNNRQYDNGNNQPASQPVSQHTHTHAHKTHKSFEFAPHFIQNVVYAVRV